MKPAGIKQDLASVGAAAFGWLSVETISLADLKEVLEAAAFGWLSVETSLMRQKKKPKKAAAFGWLSVETTNLRPNTNF